MIFCGANKQMLSEYSADCQFKSICPDQTQPNIVPTGKQHRYKYFPPPKNSLTDNENIFSDRLISLFLNEGMLLGELWSHSWLSIKLKVPRRWTKQINSSKCTNKYKLSYFYQPSKLWLKTHLSAHPHRWGIHLELSIIVLKRDLQRSTEVKV